MKLVAGIIPLTLLGCAGSPTSDTGPVARCETTDCFFQRDVRDFDIVDRSTLIVYVGRQRCPFVVELDGFDCDLTFTPQIEFFQGTPGNLGNVSPVSSGQVCSSTRSLHVYTGILDPGGLTSDSPIDPRTGRQTDTERFDRPLGGGEVGVGRGRGEGFPDAISMEDACRVRDIRSINDDQLIELYVEEGVVAPLPPIGAGEIQVPEAEASSGDQPAATEPDGSAGDPEAAQ